MFAGFFVMSCASHEPDVVYKDLGEIARNNATFSASLTPGAEGSSCVEDGVFTNCFTGDAGAAGVGECKQGKQYCIGGKRTACEGSVTPTTEICDGKDNDCDAKTDEDAAGVTMSMSCYDGPSGVQGIGECKSGTSTCTAGTWGSCVGSGTPSPETCDGKDNDCDAVTDENQAGTALTQSCYGGNMANSGVGECKTGLQTCSAGTFGTCLGWVAPNVELCDAKDNDCDASTDEDFADLSSSCSTGVGACMKSGSKVCKADGTGTMCNAVAGSPVAEMCNGLDDDCDSLSDEGTDGGALTGSCYTGPAVAEDVGECKSGTWTCSAGMWGSCVGSVLPLPETCDGKDNDCDNWKDENATNDGPMTKSCTNVPEDNVGLGACKGGMQVCFNGAFSGSCWGDTMPVTEVCSDNVDNDCNGQIDTDCNYMDACEDEDGDGYGYFCEKGWDCDDDDKFVNPAAPEWNDDMTDNNCDGIVDETTGFDQDPGNLLVIVNSTGTCPLSDYYVMSNFEGVETPTVKQFNAWQGDAFADTWWYEATGVTSGSYWLNVEFDNNGSAGGGMNADPTYVFWNTDMDPDQVSTMDCVTVDVYWQGMWVTCTSTETPSATYPFPKANLVCNLSSPPT